MSIAYLADYHPLADSTGCVALWRAVIYRALCDACFQYFDQYMMQKHAFVNAGPQQISHANWRFAYDARRFLLADNSGFINICLFADIDGTAASSGVKRPQPLAGKDRWPAGIAVQSRNQEYHYRQRNEPAAADRRRVATIASAAICSSDGSQGNWPSLR
jgi:hypothetical protein